MDPFGPCLQPFQPPTAPPRTPPLLASGPAWLFAPACPNASHLVDTARRHIVILPPYETASHRPHSESFGRIGVVFGHLESFEFLDTSLRPLHALLFAPTKQTLHRLCKQDVRKETGHCPTRSRMLLYQGSAINMKTLQSLMKEL